MRAFGHHSCMTDQPLDDREDAEPELPPDDEDEPEEDE
jgi:hypothetical protein